MKIINTYTLILFLLFNISVSSFGQKDRIDTIHLAAFSLHAAKRSILKGDYDSEEIKNLGHISRIWGAALNENNDLILIGERNPNYPCISLNQAVTALITRDKIKSKEENPGVSIEPYDKSYPFSVQKVKYSGGIENTDYGRVVFEADLLLKMLSQGYLTTGLQEIPSEFELYIDNQKAGRRIDPWENTYNRSWFFPTKLNYRQDDKCVAVTSITIDVKNELDDRTSLPRTSIATDERKIDSLLESDPLRLSPIYARLLSQHFKTLALQYPVLYELQNLFSLSGLLQKLLEDKSFEDEWFWNYVYNQKNVYTPTEIPTLKRSVSGLSYSYAVSGGISLMTEEITDPWTEEVLFKNPVYLQEGALNARPDSTSISWVIPLGYGEPYEWTPELLKRLNKDESDRIGNLYHSAKEESCNCINDQDIYATLLSKPSPQKTLNWAPNTEGKHLFSFEGTFFANTGGWEIQDNARIFRVGGTDLSAGVIPTLRFVLDNRFEFKIEAPIRLGLQVTEEPSTLPGIAEISSGLNFGIENPSITSRIFLYGRNIDQAFLTPQLILNNSAIVPKSLTAFEVDISGDKEYPPLGGFENWSSTHAFEASIPLSSKIVYQLYGGYQSIWKTDISRFILDSNLLINVDDENDLSVALRSRTAFNSTGDDDKKYRRGNNIIMASFLYPKKYGYNSVGIGYYSPNNAFTKGGLLIDVRFSGDRLWNIRKWFGK